MAKLGKITRRQFVASAVPVTALAAISVQSSGISQTLTTKGDNAMKLTPYLLFDGKCSEAMEFYKSVFGGELTMTKVKDSPAAAQMQAFQQEKILNSHLKSAAVQISASDWLAVNETPVRGNTVCLFLSGGAFQDLKSIFDKLSEGAKVTNPLKELFFGVYGALNDKFGVRWMFQSNEK